MLLAGSCPSQAQLGRPTVGQPGKGVFRVVGRNGAETGNGNGGGDARERERQKKNEGKGTRYEGVYKGCWRLAKIAWVGFCSLGGK